MGTIIFITSFFGNGKSNVPKVATEAMPRYVVKRNSNRKYEHIKY
jgi:hypothetical protein